MLADIDLASQAITLRNQNIPSPDASFVIISPDGNSIYATQEVAAGKVRQLSTTTGALIAEQNSTGQNPTHLALSPDGKKLAVANYNSGDVGIYSLNAQGQLAGIASQTFHPSAGNTHAHWVGWNKTNNILYQVDLGAGKVYGYKPNGTGGFEAPFTALTVPAADGPRHLAFHPTLPIAYVADELAAFLVTAAINADGTFTVMSTMSTLPAGSGAAKKVAHIQVSADGKHVYVSNRGHDSIAKFDLDAQGKPSAPNFTLTGGRTPRGFKLFDAAGLLVVANQDSGNLILFKVDPITGNLTNTGKSLTGLTMPVVVDGGIGAKFLAGSSSSSSSAGSSLVQQGKVNFSMKCSGCHNLANTGDAIFRAKTATIDQITTTIVNRMSARSIATGKGACTADCATSTATYLNAIFTGSLALTSALP